MRGERSPYGIRVFVAGNREQLATGARGRIRSQRDVHHARRQTRFGCQRHRAQDSDLAQRILNRLRACQQRIEGASVRGQADDIERGALVGNGALASGKNSFGARQRCVITETDLRRPQARTQRLCVGALTGPRHRTDGAGDRLQ